MCRFKGNQTEELPSKLLTLTGPLLALPSLVKIMVLSGLPLVSFPICDSTGGFKFKTPPVPFPGGWLWLQLLCAGASPSRVQEPCVF